MTRTAALSVARRTRPGSLFFMVAMEQHAVRRHVGLGTPRVLDVRERPMWQTRVPTFMARKRSCAARTKSSWTRRTRTGGEMD